MQVRVNYDNLQEAISTVEEFAATGATQLILNLRHPDPSGIATRLADDLVPRLR